MTPEMTASGRFQLSIDLAGKGYEDLRRRYEEAMRKTRREKPELLRVILEDWLRSYETGEAVRPLAPPEDEPPRSKSGERKRVSR
jgi:hypothetical protein